MVSFLMIGSLILGLMAWILPIYSIMRNKRDNRHWAIYSIISIGACATSICFQLLYSNLMVQISDFSALMDTSGTSTLLSVILLISTLILNGAYVNIYRKI